MRCPNCNSDEGTKLSRVSLNGISDIRTRSRGRGVDFGETSGALSFKFRGRGTFQTHLSKLAGPPKKLRYRHVVLWWALGLAIIYWLFGELVWIHQLSAVRSVTLFPQCAHAYSGLALRVLAFLGWCNHRVCPQRFGLRERSFMCDRCGNNFRPFELQEAA
jgi:hypothetical protein